MDIKTIEREAVSSAVIDFGIFNSEKNDYYIKGFLTGALWRINSVWHEPFEHPADGQYLTILRQGDQILSEIVPWKDGKYHGKVHSQISSKGYEVIKYADVCDLIPEMKGIDLNMSDRSAESDSNGKEKMVEKKIHRILICQINEEVNLNETLLNQGFDSLDVVEICMKIENEFDTSFDFNWVNDETTGSEIINYVNQTLANK